MGAGAAKAAAPGGGVDAGGGGKSEQGAKGYCRKGEAMRKKHFRRRWSVRQKFFQTRAGKRLQSAVYSLHMKFPENKALKRLLYFLLPF